MSQGNLHVVFGAGQVGIPLARLLASRGHAVRLVSRSGRTLPGADRGIEVVASDARDAAATRAVVQGASAVYHCMNPRYDARTWEIELHPSRRTWSPPPEAPVPDWSSSTTSTRSGAPAAAP